MSISGHPSQTRRFKRALVLGIALVATVVGAVVLHRSSGADQPTVDLTYTWGGSEGKPSCAYDPQANTVNAKIRIAGEAGRRHEVTITVTAYADENTSEPVGSGSRSVQIEGTLDRVVAIIIPVEKSPHRGEDGETACTRSVE